VGLLTRRTLLLQFLIPFPSVAISSALRDEISTTRFMSTVRRPTCLPRVAKTSTRGTLRREGAWSWEADEREKRRFIVFLKLSVLRVVVAARLLRPDEECGSNYQRMVRLVSNEPYHMDLHHRKTY